MRLKLLAALVVALLATGDARADRASTTPEPRDARWLSLSQARGAALDRHTGKIVIIGDSIAARFPREIQREAFGGSFINLGIGGDRTEHLLSRLPHYDFARARPRAVILIIGTNNLRMNDTPEEIVAGILAAVREIREETAAPLMVSEILPRGRDLAFHQADIAAVNRQLAEAAPAAGFQLLRTHEAIAAAAQRQGVAAIFVDSAHLTPAGYGILADQIRLLLPSEEEGRAGVGAPP
ncbi:GDSL-type esterase/lipase family protein [Ancylobacter radicis]|uniref:SGNH hydrolase-type esterase domain-containing protein n=1 Tax=Ancylobacter radicis TaxID=2836179 RepID=A0ABS5RB86_9HYPH|nr:GDSL-type esterase/lipase family protein [Ancylobacter radicis]MBS9478938.1 hypothetical protein [Ancylobacter radicis]